LLASKEEVRRKYLEIRSLLDPKIRKEYSERIVQNTPLLPYEG